MSGVGVRGRCQSGLVMSTRELMLRDGRRAAVHVRAGAADGRTVVFCHSAPGAGGFDPDPNATLARGVTLIGVDRPGYGRTEPMPYGSWADVGTVADDVADVLEQMGTGPVGLAGWSAGGRVALAVAARHPELVDRVVVVATPAPDEAVPWLPREQRAAVDALREQPAEAVHAALAAQFPESWRRRLHQRTAAGSQCSAPARRTTWRSRCPAPVTGWPPCSTPRSPRG